LTNKNLSLQKNIETQVQYAIDEADVIVFMVSAKEGINAEDYYVAKLLKKHKGKKIILAVNKAENADRTQVKLYYSLGYGKPYFISSEHGIGTGDLLDEIIKIKSAGSSTDTPKHFAFCIIGKTNVGKSTLVNTILREDRVLVSPTPHTTRDSIDADFKYNDHTYTIIDTAGIRRKGKITDNIERYAVLRTEEAITRSNLILLILDGSRDFDEQDEVIGGLAYKANIPTVICINKWDIVKKDEKTMVQMTKLIRQRFKYLA
jgi:GTP-binding protein